MKQFIVILFLMLNFSVTGFSQEMNCVELFSKLLPKDSTPNINAGIRINGQLKTWSKIGDDGAIALTKGSELHSAIHQIIKEAKESIYIQVSGLESEEVIETLKQKARNGLDVKVITADISKHFIGKDYKAKLLSIFDDMRAAGIEVEAFTSDDLAKNTSQLFAENHRKMIIVDSKYAYIGSSNIRMYLNNYDHGLIVKGNLAKELSNQFSEDHYTSSFRTIKEYKFQSNSNFQLLAQVALKDEIIEAISKATSSIDLVAYHLDDKAVINAIINQKKNNKDLKVTVLLGPSQSTFTLLGFYKSSIPMNNDAYKSLGDAGVEVRWGGDHLKETRSIIHAKSVIIDKEIVFGGSSDFNARSFEGNRELSYRLSSKEIGAQFSKSIRNEYKLGKDSGIISKRAPIFEKINDLLTKTIAKIRNALSFSKQQKITKNGLLDPSRIENKIDKNDIVKQYYPENSFFRDITDGSIVEGSHRFGGMQPDYEIDLSQKPIQNVLNFSRKTGNNTQLDDWEKVKSIVDHIRNDVLPNRDQKSAEYIKLMTNTLNEGKRISLSSYIDKQLGVCRENALLTHLALKEAKIKNYFAYAKLENRFGGQYDHAFVVIEVRGEKLIVDSFNPYLNGRRLKDVLKSTGSSRGDPIAPYANKIKNTIGSLAKIRIIPLTFPTVWKPVTVKK